MKKIIMLLILLGIIAVAKSQDIHFSQYTMTPLLVNPAQAGAQYDLLAIMNYKNQWRSVADPYRTYNLSFEVSSNKKKNYTGYSGYGINLYSDKAGDANMGTVQGNLNYAYHLYLTDRSTIGGGLYAAFGQRSVSFTNLQWGSQYDGMAYDPGLSSGEPAVSDNFFYLDFGGGFHWNYSKSEKYMTGNDQRNYSAGIAVFHVNQPKYSFYDSGEKLLMKEVAYANALIGIGNTNLSVVPGLIYTRQGREYELLLGSLFRYQLKENTKYTGFVKGSSIAAGVYYRSRDALIASIMYEISQYAVGISYDVNLSGLKSASNGKGGLEISLRFISPNPFLYSKTRYY